MIMRCDVVVAHTIEHTRMCVVEQTWIPLKLCLVDEGKPRRRSDQATKLGKKCE